MASSFSRALKTNRLTRKQRKATLDAPAKPKASKGPKQRVPTTKEGQALQTNKHNQAVASVLGKLGSPLPGLTASQTKIVKQILGVGRATGATKKEMVSAVETGLVESNLSNPTGGDGTSAGWRQEIDTYGSVANRTNVQAAAKRYFDETAAMGRGKGTTAGELAANVQRPREEYRGRYAEHVTQAKQVTKAFNRRSKAASKAGIDYAKVGIEPPKKLAGPWAGSKKVAMQATKGYDRGSLKRTPAENDSVGGSSTSDHLTTSGRSFAVDIPTSDGEGIARNIAKRLGIKGYSTGNYTHWTTNRPGYSAQILWNVSGHTDHVHVGIRWEDRALPPGTIEGGYGAPATTSGGASGASSSGTTEKGKKDGRSSKKDAKRKPSFFDLGQFDPLKGAPTPKLTPSQYEQAIKKRKKVDLG